MATVQDLVNLSVGKTNEERAAFCASKLDRFRLVIAGDEAVCSFRRDGQEYEKRMAFGPMSGEEAAVDELLTAAETLILTAGLV